MKVTIVQGEALIRTGGYQQPAGFTGSMAKESVAQDNQKHLLEMGGRY